VNEMSEGPGKAHVRPASWRRPGNSFAALQSGARLQPDREAVSSPPGLVAALVLLGAG